MTRKMRDAVRRLRELAYEGPSDEELRDAYGALGDQIADARARHRLSQRELAELCGTTQSAIARLEGGGRAPRLDTLIRIADALDCELVVRLRPRTRGGKR